MPPGTPVPQVTQIQFTNSGTTININFNPPVLRVPNSKVQQVKLLWNISGSGAQFPETNFFRWKTGSGTPDVTRKDATTLESASYLPDFEHGARWTYEITLSNATYTVNLDPEVDNQPPSGGGGDDEDVKHGGGPKPR